MKRYGKLYNQITATENLFLAASKAQKGKRFNNNVSRFNLRLESQLYKLQEELVSKTYQPGKYREFYIYEPKKRMISAAPYRDRVVHHALCNIIEPIFEKGFIFDSYANRTGKGTHAAIERSQQFARKNKYVVKFDIKKYFPSIVRSILKSEIRKKLKCKDTLWLIDIIIDNSNEQELVNEYFEGDDLFSNLYFEKGLPMGNLTSQFFANVYLNPLDHFVKEHLRKKYYLRYVDDFLVFSNSKAESRMVIEEIRAFLGDFRLKLHENKTKIFRTELGFNFLGQRIFPSHRHLAKENVKRARKRLEKKFEMYKKGHLLKSKFVESYIAWHGHAINANTNYLRNQFNAKFVELLWDEPFFKGTTFVSKEQAQQNAASWWFL